MRHRGSFQRIGLAAMLLVGGMLGGLLAPLHSQAKTLTIQVDEGAVVEITPLLLSAGCPTGFNDCSYINGQPTATGSNNRSFQVQPAPGTSATAAKLLIGDYAATDAFKFTGVKIAPTSTWPSTESHVVKIVATHTLSANPNGAGNYVWALRTGGYLLGGGSPLTTQYDLLRFEGTGIFNPDMGEVQLLNVAPQTVNLDPLQLQVANSSSSVYFTLSQVVTYPTFNCDADGAAGSGTVCTPILKLTMTVTLFGPDALVLTDSNDGQGGGPCNLDNSKGGSGGPPGGNPAIPCHGNTKKKSEDNLITESFTNYTNTDITTSRLDGVTEQAVNCTEADNCPCANPLDIKCAANVVHVLHVTPGLIETFPFIAEGSGISPDWDNYTITTDANGDGSTPIGPLPALGGGPWTFRNGDFPRPSATNKVYEVDQINCASALEPADPSTIDLNDFTTWESLVANDGNRFLKVYTLKGGDTLTCKWHVHMKALQQ